MESFPSGWHLPSNEEWKTLEQHFGMNSEDLNRNCGWQRSGEAGKQSVHRG
jgi:uncharacterized protein (TIGR02145 family)